MSRVVEVTEEQLRARREELLAKIAPVTFEELVDRAHEGSLVDVEWDVLDELYSIAFLLEE